MKLLLGVVFSFCMLQTKGQDAPVYPKNAMSFNLTQYAVNELNFGYEVFISQYRSVELNGGLIYKNSIWADLTKNLDDPLYFSERGFATRFVYRIYKKEISKAGNRSYIAPMLVYKYQYLNQQWLEVDEKDNNDVTHHYCSYVTRFRSKIGLQFFWGKIVPLSKTFALDLYLGTGLRATLSDRWELYKSENECIMNDKTFINFRTNNFYLRPTIHGGVRLKIMY